MTFPELPSAVRVETADDVDDLWQRFELFEAFHHTMSIDNPMSSDDLDAVVSILNPVAGAGVLDLACGHGELLRRLHRLVPIRGTGVDLSPWMLATAHRLAQPEASGLRWVLGDAKHHGVDGAYDIVTCLGASWVWHGLRGTIREVAKRVAPGGRIAVGDMHLRAGLDPATLRETHGSLDSTGTIAEFFAESGIELIGGVTTSNAAWDDYLARTKEAALVWATNGEATLTADKVLSEWDEWASNQARDRKILTWTVWVGRRAT